MLRDGAVDELVSSAEWTAKRTSDAWTPATTACSSESRTGRAPTAATSIIESRQRRQPTHALAFVTAARIRADFSVGAAQKLVVRIRIGAA